MAENEEPERQIPVFTVIKNGAILKNIFLINKPPPPSIVGNGDDPVQDCEEEEEEEEEILVVGRHPDCHIVLTHPSVSRFHLQIHPKRDSQNLSVIDLKSVHGTWVSGIKIESCVPVGMNEGDTLRVGSSTRVYRLHWIPMSQAYDMDNPSVSRLDVPMEDDKPEENELFVDENKVEAPKGEKSESIEIGKVEVRDPLVVEPKENEFFVNENDLEALKGDKSESIEIGKSEVRDSLIVELKENEIFVNDNDLEALKGEKSDLFETGESEVRDSFVVEKKEEEIYQALNSLSIEEFRHDEGKDSFEVERKEEGICQDEISMSVQNEEVQFLDWTLEGIVLLFSEEKSEFIPYTEIPSSGTESMDLFSPAGGNPSVLEEQQFDKNDQIICHDSMTEIISERENSESSVRRLEEESEVLVNMVASPSNEKQWETADETENQSPLQVENEIINNLDVWSGSIMKGSDNSSLISGGVLPEMKTEQVNKENQTPQSLVVLQPLVGEMKEESSVDRKMNLPVTLNSASFNEECYLAAELFEAENNCLVTEGHEQKGFCSALLEAESVNSSLPLGEVLSEITDNKNSQTPQSMFVTERFGDEENSEVSPLRSDKKLSLHSIWSRRGKPASVLQIQTGRSRGKTTGGQNNADVQLQKQEDIENKSISKKLFVDSERKEEEIFTPDKENFSPDTLLLKSFKRKCNLGETKLSRSCRKSCSKVTISPDIQPEEDLIFSSDKENQTPKVLQENKLARQTSRNKIKLEEQRVLRKKRAERVPFQTLVANSPGQRRSEDSLLNATTRSSNSVNFTQTMTRVTNSSSLGEGRRTWAMIVDTTTLLDKESRKSLQLLQGLRGTQLIIPRMVIRELDCLKRRGSLFRRTTEVSSLLEWIEECMVKTKWWIHIQSTVEEGSQIAPTPPASPKSLFSEGSSGGFPGGTTSWGAFSSRTSLTEIVSPTAEDHILDCALLFRKMKIDGQLVLLSNDVTLKIKAMAEGLICETAEEFRESLVNPFSERFLWADSSPRGLTWSYLDDEVLREKYRRGGPLKKPSKGGDGAKGLKLILLHNSHYAQMSSVR